MDNMKPLMSIDESGHNLVAHWVTQILGTAVHIAVAPLPSFSFARSSERKSCSWTWSGVAVEESAAAGMCQKGTEHRTYAWNEKITFEKQAQTSLSKCHISNVHVIVALSVVTPNLMASQLYVYSFGAESGVSLFMDKTHNRPNFFASKEALEHETQLQK